MKDRKRIVAADFLKRNSNCSHLTDSSCLFSVKERSVPLLLITPSQRFFRAKVTEKKKNKKKQIAPLCRGQQLLKQARAIPKVEVGKK